MCERELLVRCKRRPKTRNEVCTYLPLHTGVAKLADLRGMEEGGQHEEEKLVALEHVQVRVDAWLWYTYR